MAEKVALIGGATYTRADLEALPRDPTLRNFARAMVQAGKLNVSLTWIGSAASKTDLIDLLLGEVKGDGSYATRGSNDLSTLSASQNGNGKTPAELMAEAVAAIAAQTESSVTSTALEERLEAHKASLMAEFEALLAKGATKRIELVRLDGSRVNVGKAHRTWPRLLARVQAALAEGAPGPARNLWLIGPAGAGKTYAIEQIATALGLDFAFNGAIDTEYKLLGFTDAQGRIVNRPFRRIYENGGIYLFDELDGSMPSACLALNAALANGMCDFPDGSVKRHPECVIIASGNVWNGATDQYVARFKPDAAFANRFGVKIRWDYDEELEEALGGNSDWVALVQRCRRNALRHGVQFIISPRASEAGAHLLRCGIPWDEVVEDCLRQGLPDDKWNLVFGG